MHTASIRLYVCAGSNQLKPSYSSSFVYGIKMSTVKLKKSVSSTSTELNGVKYERASTEFVYVIFIAIIGMFTRGPFFAGNMYYMQY